MYNRYIPEDTSYTQIEESVSPPAPRNVSGSAPASERRSRPTAISLPSFLTEKEGLSGIFKSLRLDRFDSGDILLLLIMLYLMAEGDDLELVIALGLTLIMGLGDSKKED